MESGERPQEEQNVVVESQEGLQEKRSLSRQSSAVQSTPDAVAEDSPAKDARMTWASPPSMSSFVADSQQTPSETFETPPRNKANASSATDGEGPTSDASAMQEKLSVENSVGQGGASSIEEAQNSEEAPCLDQSERVLEQMRRCVLVHHQLSCLLIHNAALRAGLYGDNGNVGGKPPRHGEELEESIHHMGGSTARLFSMALKDRHDLEAMEDTLRQRVEEMVQAMRSEFQLAGCSAECSPVTTAHVLALAGAKDGMGMSFTDSGAKSLQSHNEERCEASAAGADGPGHEIATGDSCTGAAKLAATVEAEIEEAEEAAAAECEAAQAEVEATLRECQRLSTELASQQLHVARLREELREVQRGSEGFHQCVTVTCFDEVQRATDRNEELEEMLEQLTAYPQVHFQQPPHAARGTQVLTERPTRVQESTVLQRRGPQGPMLSSRLAERSSAPAVLIEPEVTKIDGRQLVAPPEVSGYVALQRPAPDTQAITNIGAGARGRTRSRGKAGMLTSPESLAQLDQQLRVSQSEFWGM
mmetsp:Transcript_57823/g.96284  ORF Transcript_57823/g.96284 Transcript_57823/m.96284 type:complete len:533 (-) Transcript_57823:26-1624(-)